MPAISSIQATANVISRSAGQATRIYRLTQPGFEGGFLYDGVNSALPSASTKVSEGSLIRIVGFLNFCLERYDLCLREAEFDQIDNPVCTGYTRSGRLLRSA